MQQCELPALREETATLAEQVYRALLGAILERRLRPGARLTLDDLAAQLKVSRTPVRDAVARLAAEGLVQTAGRRGFCVPVLSAEELSELYDLRLMCELFAVEQGIGNLTPALLAEMTALAESCLEIVRAEDSSAVLALALQDKAMHELIVGLAGNRRLSEFYERLSIHVQTYRAGYYPVRGPDMEPLFRREHGDILAALQAGEVGAAKEAVRAHISAAKHRALLWLQLR